MKNIKMNLNDNILTITVDLSKDFGLSKSGKTSIIATTAGNKSIPGFDNVRVGVNVYKVKEG